MKKATNVDEYIASFPENIQDRFKLIRKIIFEAVPKAEEKISYGMPYYGYLGRLAYFAGYKNHIGLYLTPPLVEKFKKELKPYVTSTATIQIPNDKELPVALITKLVSARARMNEELKK